MLQLRTSRLIACLGQRLALLLLMSLLVAAPGAGCGKRDERIDMSRYVLIYPGAPVVELPGDSGKVTVQVRNVSETKLTGLVLQVKSEACAARVEPARIEALVPGERKPFSVALTRRKGKPRQRYPFELTLRAGGLPVPAGLDLQVDTSPPLKEGWIDVGQVTLIQREQSKSAYYLLAGLPLLLVLGWLLWRFSRPGRKKERRGASKA